MNQINSLSDSYVDAWLAYCLDYSNIGVVNGRLYACDPIQGSWQPVDFHTENVGTELIDTQPVSIEPHWKEGVHIGWRAHCRNGMFSGAGVSHRQAALRCILATLMNSRDVPSDLPPAKRK
jgi:hypothetical protein